MKLSRTVSYALQATLQLAQSGSEQPVPCSHLAAAGKMPERFLLQILRSLVAHGVLQSTRGVDGGYVLQRPAEEVSLLEVIEAIEGPLVASLPSAEGLPEGAHAKLERAVHEINALVRRQLQAITLSELLPETVAVAAGRSSDSRGARIAGGKIVVRPQPSKTS